MNMKIFNCKHLRVLIISYIIFLSVSQYEDVAEKDDLMGVEDTAKKDILLKPP